MKGVNVIIKDGLKNELKDFAKQVCVRAADYARDTLTDIAYEAFERFYCDYTPVPGGINTSYQWKFATPSGVPKEYRRTYNILKYGIEKYDNKHGKIVRGGVILNSNNLLDNYNESPEDVFTSIYKFGWHGPMGSRVSNMVPTPEELIEQSYDNLCNSVLSTVVRNEIPNVLTDGNYEYLHRKVYHIGKYR